MIGRKGFIVSMLLLINMSVWAKEPLFKGVELGVTQAVFKKEFSEFVCAPPERENRRLSICRALKTTYGEIPVDEIEATSGQQTSKH